jgi:hypothetical protein
MTGFVTLAIAAATLLPQPAPAGSSGMDALLAEVRALRAELTQIAGASIRMQLLVARLQVQEQRVNSISRQLTTVREELSAIAQIRTTIGAQFKDFENEGRAEGLPATDEKAGNPLKAMLDGQAKREKELKEQETALEAQLVTEQSRWTEFNDRLDAVEQELQLPPRR